MSYDRAITVFSPDGHLFQVEYAMEAVRKGSTAVGVRGSTVVVLGVEKKSYSALQESHTVRKLAKLDHHLCLAFAGLTADARVLINRARIEAQSHKLNYEDKMSVEQMARFIGVLQQKYTQAGGRRPFGLSVLIAGHDEQSHKPHLYHSDPSGIFTEWTANAIGRNSKTVVEWLEKHHTDADNANEDQAVRITIKALLEVVDIGSQQIEVAVVRDGRGMELLSQEHVDALTKEINEEKEKEKAKEPKKDAASSSSSS